jgi:hypothetical protein
MSKIEGKTDNSNGLTKYKDTMSRTKAADIFNASRISSRAEGSGIIINNRIDITLNARIKSLFFLNISPESIF